MKNKNKVKTYKEFEDAPSGSVYFYNYKEPLMEFKPGYGFLGALIHDDATGKVQCHFCGKWFEALGNHLHKEHNMSASEYKKKVGLNTSTALISEPYRDKLIANGLERRIKNLRKWKGIKRSKATRAKISATLKEYRAEKQNQNNTCPEQLLERLLVEFKKNGRTPNLHRGGGSGRPKGIPFRETLIKVYGSMENACKMAGIPYRKPGETVRGKYAKAMTKEKAVSHVISFFAEHKTLPVKRAEWGHKLADAIMRHKISKKEIAKLALSQDGVYKKSGSILRYDKDTLIDFLRIFEKNNSRKPAASDCRRGLLPHQSRYTYNFGSWKKALDIAFPN